MVKGKMKNKKLNLELVKLLYELSHQGWEKEKEIDEASQAMESTNVDFKKWVLRKHNKEPNFKSQ